MRMDKSSLLLSTVFGLVFAAALVLHHATDQNHATRFGIAGFLFGAYCFYFAWPTFHKKPKRRPLLLQVSLGGGLGGTIVALFSGTAVAVVVGVVFGIILGFVADIWARHVSLP